MKIVSLLLSVLLCGCAATPAHLKSQSWDQENLKRNDHGCPTAIFIAPDGNLQQCDLTIEGKVVIVPAAYDTVEQAAIAGLKAVAVEPTSSYYEWGGVIVKTSRGKFIALTANTNFQGDSVRIHSGDFILPGMTIVSSYHTHPCIPEHYVQFFSPSDLIEPLFSRRIVFMGDLCTGNVHEFKPGDKTDAEHPLADEETLWLTKGRIIGKFTTPHLLAVVE